MGTVAWQNLVENVSELKKKGLTHDEIVIIVKQDKSVINRILEDDNIADINARLLFEKQKVPLIKDLVQCSLGIMKKTLAEIAANDNLRRRFISKTSDIALFQKTIESLNTLLRLELGKSTQNIETHAHTYESTRIAVQELKKIDPVFAYPDLPPPIDVTPKEPSSE